MGLLTITKLTESVGAEVTGLDPGSLASDDPVGEAVLDALEDNGVLVFRGLQLDPEAQVGYSRRFGPVVPHPSKSTRHPVIPEVTMLGINKFDADGKLNDATAVKVGMTNSCLYAYVADGRNGLKVLQLTSADEPKLNHDSSTNALIRRYRDGSKA